MGIGQQILDESSIFSKTPKFAEKMMGKNVRLRWGGSGWTGNYMWIEEMPGKPVKRKVRLMEVKTDWFVAQHLDGFLLVNLVQDAKLKKSMNYDQMVKAMKDVVEEVVKTYEGQPAGRIKRPFEFDRYGGMAGVFHEYTVSYLEVEPEDHKPLKVKMKDGSVLSSSWSEFLVYSPSYDPRRDRPHFISNKSPGGARKIYKMLKADPNALAAVEYMTLTRFLKKNKVAYSWV